MPASTPAASASTDRTPQEATNSAALRAMSAGGWPGGMNSHTASPVAAAVVASAGSVPPVKAAQVTTGKYKAKGTTTAA